jgi:hypothetical protein
VSSSRRAIWRLKPAIEQANRQKAEADAAIAKRDRLYRGLGKCRDCGAMNTDPFPQKKD